MRRGGKFGGVAIATTALQNVLRRSRALRQATSTAGELLALSGPRSPYRDGPPGVIQEGAYADMVLVDGNPLENLDLVADPGENFVVIMKDGRIYKNTLP